METAASLQIQELVTAFLQSDIVLWLILVIIMFILKDAIASFAKGVGFKLFKSEFKRGNTIYIDDTEYTVINIGLTETVLQTIQDQKVIWRYIPNEKISSLKVSVVIDDNTKNNKL